MKKVTFPAFFTFVFISLFSVLSCQNQDDDILQNAWNNRPKECSVVFNSNGGSGSMPALETTEIVGKTLTANSFARSGYVFDGWNTASDGTGSNFADGAALSTVFGSTGAVVTLYAKWTPCYTITFDSNNGTGDYFEQTYVLGIAQNIQKNPFTKIGYGFIGWSTDKNAASAEFSDMEEIQVSSSFMVYAIWTPDIYTVTFYSNNGSGDSVTQTFVQDVYQKLTTNSFSRTGYTFTGWGTSNDDTTSVYSDGQNVTFTSNTELYAIWSINSYTLSFYPNGGSGSAYSRTVTYNASETVDSCSFGVPVGYYFGTWYTNSDGTGSEYTVGSSFNMPAYDVSLYAYWIEKPAHSITYYNTNSAENTNQTSYREKDSVTISDLTLTNYKFEGWYLNNEGSAISGWSAGTYSENLSLYAKWTYPDTLKAKDGKFGYACGNISLTYTLTYTASAGNYSKTFTYHSGDDTPGASTLTDVPLAAVKDGVTWTVTLVGVNTEYGLKYSGSATSTISNNELSLTIPALTRVN